MKSVDKLKEYNPRINYREKEYSPEYIFSKVLEHWKKEVSITDCINTFFEGMNLKAIIYPDTISILTKLKGLQQISVNYNVPIKELIFVGDEEKDRKTAINAGCRFILINRKERVCDGIYNLYKLITLLENSGQSDCNK